MTPQSDEPPTRPDGTPPSSGTASADGARGVEDSIRELLGPEFEPTSEIGRGSTSVVFAATLVRAWRDVPLGTEVAIKLLHADRAGDDKAVRRLEREAELGQQVESPHVARFFGAETRTRGDRTATFLVMQRIAGHTLRAFLRANDYAIEALGRRIGVDAARGLQAMHEAGLVHRDIKPENLALTPEGRVVVMDLGLAKPVTRGSTPAASPPPPKRSGTIDPRISSQSGGFFGSLAYAAPEILRGRPATGPSDLYALGMVLYEVVTGRHPFIEPDEPVEADDLIAAHLERTPQKPSHHVPRLSALYDELIVDLLAKRPADRIESAAALSEALDTGEASRYWIAHERAAPGLSAQRRLRALRRFAPTPLIGRRDELRELDRLLLRVTANGRGIAVRVTGPLGFGRRRLLDEAIAGWIDEREDIAFLGGRADPRSVRVRGMPFPALVLDWYLRGDGEDSPQAEARLALRITAESRLEEAEAGVLAALATGSDTTTSPEQRADLLARALASIARSGRTLVLRIDRAERLESTGSLVVHRLIDELPHAPILLLLVDEPGPSDWPMPHRELQVSGLPIHDWVEYGRALFRARSRNDRLDELLRSAHSILAGSPDALLESLEGMVQAEQLSGRPGAYHGLRAVTELRPAAPLLERIATLTASLAPDQRHVLFAAAVLGDSFPLKDLLTLTDRSELAVLEALSATYVQLVSAVGGATQWRHTDYRQRVLDAMPVATRERLHRLAAFCLEERGANDLEVGLHYSRAREHSAAIPPLLIGLDQLVTSGSRHAALRVAKRLRIHFHALTRTPELVALRIRFLLLAGQAHALAEEPMPAMRALRRAYRLAVQTDDAVARARALVRLAELAIGQGQLLAALRLLEQAEHGPVADAMDNERAAGAKRPKDPPNKRRSLRAKRRGILDDAPTVQSALQAAAWRSLRAERARAFGLHARVLGYLGQVDDGLQAVRRALELLPDGATNVEAWLRVDRARLSVLGQRYDVALRDLDAADHTFESGRGDPVGLARTQLYRGWTLALLGDTRHAIRALEDAIERSHRLADVRGQARGLLWLGDALEANGDHQEAMTRWFDAHGTARHCGDRVTAAFAAIRLNQHGVSTPDLIREAEDLGVPAVHAGYLLNEWTRAVAAGRLDEAEGLMEQAAEIEREASLPWPLRLRILAAADGQDTAEETLETIARRLPITRRRRFLRRGQQILAENSTFGTSDETDSSDDSKE